MKKRRSLRWIILAVLLLLLGGIAYRWYMYHIYDPFNEPYPTYPDLFINGKQVEVGDFSQERTIEDAHMYMIDRGDEVSRYACLPFTVIVRELGCPVAWCGEGSAILTIRGQRYELSLPNAILSRPGESENLIVTADGFVIHSRYSPDTSELYLDNHTIVATLNSLGMDVSIDVNYEDNTVAVTGREKPDWEKCTVRTINYLHGTEFFVFCSDGSYSVSYTPHICSLEAFNEGRCPVEEGKTGTLPEEELEELLRIVSSVYTDGQMLPIEEREGEYIPEGLFVYFSVDDSEEAFYLYCHGDSLEDSLPKDYYELIQFAHSVYPETFTLWWFPVE